jgi:hypothetical protein
MLAEETMQATWVQWRCRDNATSMAQELRLAAITFRENGGPIHS